LLGETQERFFHEVNEAVYLLIVIKLKAAALADDT
jgi:hypothetical protein